MKSLLQKLLLSAVQEFAQKTFTFENVQGARDRFLALLQEQVQTTETGVDDWAYTIVERMIADDNLKRCSIGRGSMPTPCSTCRFAKPPRKRH